MLTVSPDVVSPLCDDVDDDTTGDPDCGFRLTHPELHVCTDRDGQVVVGDKACFAWARQQLFGPVHVNPRLIAGTGAFDPALRGTVVERVDPANSPFPPPSDRCENCGGAGTVFVATQRWGNEDDGYDVDGYMLCDDCADVPSSVAS
jgi:hypothetical protein